MRIRKTTIEKSVPKKERTDLKTKNVLNVCLLNRCSSWVRLHCPWRFTVASAGPGWRLYGGLAVRNLVGRLGGGLRPYLGWAFIYTRSRKNFASVSPYFCNWLWGCSCTRKPNARASSRGWRHWACSGDVGLANDIPENRKISNVASKNTALRGMRVCACPNALAGGIGRFSGMSGAETTSPKIKDFIILPSGRRHCGKCLPGRFTCMGWTPLGVLRGCRAQKRHPRKPHNLQC